MCKSSWLKVKGGSALQREPRAVQEEMLVIFNFILAQTSGTCAVQVMPVSVIAQVTEFNT